MFLNLEELGPSNVRTAAPGSGSLSVGQRFDKKAYLRMSYLNLLAFFLRFRYDDHDKMNVPKRGFQTRFPLLVSMLVTLAYITGGRSGLETDQSLFHHTDFEPLLACTPAWTTSPGSVLYECGSGQTLGSVPFHTPSHPSSSSFSELRSLCPYKGR
jgi:hypothetical protein